MGPEAKFWNYLNKLMRAHWHATRHEDGQPGTPDVSYGCKGVNGWIELKAMRNWPRDKEEHLNIAHFTELQREWLKRRAIHGSGHCFVFLKVGAGVTADYILLAGEAIEKLGYVNRSWLLNKSVAVWHGKVKPKELAEVLSKEI